MILSKTSGKHKLPSLRHHSFLAIAVLLFSTPTNLVLTSTLTFTSAFVNPITSSKWNQSPLHLRSLSSSPPSIKRIPEGFRGKTNSLRAHQEKNEENKATLSASTFNLVKACVGSGVLALPAGVAAMGDTSSRLIPATLLICSMGSLSAYTFHMIGRLSHWNENNEDEQVKSTSGKTKSISQLWKDIIGEKTSWIVTLSCLLTPLALNLSYSIILGDTISSVLKTFGVQGILASRQISILGVTLGILYPISKLKSLAALAKVSMVGVLGTLLTCTFMLLRCLPGGPYDAVAQNGGRFLADLPPHLLPSFGKIATNNSLFSPSMSILASMAGTAYLAQFSAHDFYNGLENANLKRFGTLTTLGFVITTIINLAIMSFGFLTFGGASQGIILNNYSTKDFGATMCRAIVAISLIGSYPIMLRAIKSSLLDLVQKGKDMTEEANSLLTNVILAGVTAAALVLKNAGFVVSMLGALLGSAIIYIFPSMLFLKLTSKKSITRTKFLTFERLMNKCLLGFGIFQAVLGMIVTILTEFFPGILV